MSPSVRRQGGGDGGLLFKSLGDGLDWPELVWGAAACACACAWRGPTRSRSASMSGLCATVGDVMPHCLQKPGFFWSGAAAAAPPGHVRTVSTALRCRPARPRAPAQTSASHLARWLGPWSGFQGRSQRVHPLTLSEPTVNPRACRSSHGSLGRCRPGRRPRGRPEYTGQAQLELRS